MKAEELALEMLSDCVAGRTLQVARVVSAHFDRALAPFGLTAHQLTLLSIVARRQPMAARDVLPFLKMDQSTLSRNLDRMERKGWLAMSPDPEDARTRRASLTAEGEKVFFAAHKGWLEAQAWAIQALGDDGVEEVLSVAQKLNPLLPTKPSRRDEEQA